MNITVNGQAKTISKSILSDVLVELDYTSPAIATALNGSFVAKGERENTRVQANDRLDIVAPMQGG